MAMSSAQNKALTWTFVIYFFFFTNAIWRLRKKIKIKKAQVNWLFQTELWNHVMEKK